LDGPTLNTDYPANPRGLRAPGGGAVRIDRRTRQSRLYEQIRRGLIDYCGGDPSFAQLSQIDGICRITLLIAQLDPADAEHDRRLVLLNDALARSYKALGARPAAPKRRQTLAERLAEPKP
jgi:hypothetical protein